MNDYEPTNPEETTADPLTNAMSEPLTEGDSASGSAAASPPRTDSPDGSALQTLAKQARRPRTRRLLSNRRNRWIAASALTCSAVGVSLGLGLSTSSSATAASSPATAEHLRPGGGAAGGPGSGAGGSNARSGPAAGGASGTVASVSPSSFIMTTSAGQKVTVDETSSTEYETGTSSSSSSSSAATKGVEVLVLGTTSGTTITAAQVIVQPTSGGTAASATSTVIPFQAGAPTTSKQVGQIPANWSQGSGTIVSGTAANKATEAALATYPGGVVDRVVQLSNGEYNVHYIGVNWPHHVFVNQSFQVVGAE